MNTEEYEEIIEETAMYPSSGEGTTLGLAYTSLGLNGEAGEVAEKVKKLIRDSQGVLTEDRRQDILKELGDVQWYLAATARELGSTIGEVMQMNITKLRNRKQKGTIQGDGDNR